MKFKQLIFVGLALTSLLPINVFASSHREAPFVTRHPQVDGTDFYMFTSYEEGRSDFVTFIANYNPLQDAFGGPNYFAMDPDALYDIKIDNDGDAIEDITFRFRLENSLTNSGTGVTLPINGTNVSIPLVTVGAITFSDSSNRSRVTRVSVEKISGPSFRYGKDKKGHRLPSTKKVASVTNASSSSSSFSVPEDNIGNKTIADYAAYADNFVYDINIPDCDTDGKMFVGQRQEGFQVNLGEVFDLVSTNPLGEVDAENSDTADKNIFTFALEIPKSCLGINSEDPIIGAWTTSSLPQRTVLSSVPSFDKPERNSTKTYVQTSRLSSPLVNEVVIGLPDKDKFNSSQPKDDTQFATYVTNPTVPTILETLFGVTAPTLFPRTDLIDAFLRGVSGLNQRSDTGLPLAEMLRLNTSTTPADAASQNNLGVIASDNAGFPNGRRPGDDTVDIVLRVAMGVLLSEENAPSGQLAYTDGALNNAAQFDSSFPYMKGPVAGAVSTDD